MKALLVCLLVATVAATDFHLFVEPAVSDHDPAVYEFIKGFLKGIGETESIDDLYKCMKNIEKLKDQVLQFLEYMKEMSMESIVKGLELLIKIVKEFTEASKPCISEYKVLQKLLKAIHNTKFNELLKRFLMHATHLFKCVVDIIKCIHDGHYEAAGEGFGTIIKDLFLPTLSEEIGGPRIEDFAIGFLTGIGETGNKTHILQCIKEMESVIPMIKQAFEKIKSRNIKQIQEGVKELIIAVKKLLEYAQPCSAELPVLLKLIHAVSHVHPTDVVKRVLTHMQDLVILITKALACFASHDYKCGGEVFGAVLKILFLD